MSEADGGCSWTSRSPTRMSASSGLRPTAGPLPSTLVVPSPDRLPLRGWSRGGRARCFVEIGSSPSLGFERGWTLLSSMRLIPSFIPSLFTSPALCLRNLVSICISRRPVPRHGAGLGLGWDALYHDISSETDGLSVVHADDRC